MASNRFWMPFSLWIIGVSVIISVWGCSAVTPPAVPSSAPFFVPTAGDTERVAKMSHDLDTKVLHCMEAVNCERLSYARGLISLFENQEAARASFRQVIDHNPASPLATTSRQWLTLISDHEAGTSQCPSTDIVAELLRDWMQRQVSADRPAAPLATEDTLDEQTRIVNGVVQVLDKQVRERDRRIAILQSKLEALKVIDEDHEQRKRVIRVPATLP